jgi:hypothetical protein
MAVEAVTIRAAPATQAPARPYVRSWLDRLLDAIETLPVPAPLAYLAIAVAAVVVIYAEPWTMGAVSPFAPMEKLYWGGMIGAQLAAAGYVRRVAGSAFDAFRPALPLPEPELARLRYRLTIMPAGPAFAAAGVALALAAASLAINPAAIGTVPLTGTLLVGAFVLQGWLSAVMFVLLLQLLRQVREIRQLLARAAVADLFRPGPLHAFSRVSAVTGGLLVLFIASSFLVIPIPSDPGALLVGWLPYLVLPPVIAMGAFVLPLSGMHGRLVAEKERLQGEAEDRLQIVFAELNRDVDQRAVARADALNKTLLSMLQQRDVLAKLPTWPWSSGTLRGFVTAIFLPLALFLLQRVLSQLV